MAVRPIDPRERFGGDFAASVCCMDGRIQLPIIKFIQGRYGVRFVDIITEPGPIRYLADRKNHSVLETIRKRLQISVEVHGSRVIAVSGHHDCAGNPAPKRTQLEQLARSVKTLSSWGFEGQDVVKLWVNERWEVDIVD
jgi:carbonic anhydrase